jgi:uncharacterized linocin/CFP29 family protein
MNNLHRELAPISDAAWAGIEEEAKRTFTLHLAGRRVAEVQGPGGTSLAAVGTGHLADVSPPIDGVAARLRQVQPLVELRVPFSLSRQTIDDVERGAGDPDWQPVIDAARTIATAEDRIIFSGYTAGHVPGVQTSGPDRQPRELPADPRMYPDAISQAVTALRLRGIGGPYSLLLNADAYTAVSETSDHGYPVREHLTRVVDGEIIWAPAIDGAALVSQRGGDYELHLGQDLSIGYQSHDAGQVVLYFVESLTFRVLTPEAAIAFRLGSAATS